MMKSFKYPLLLQKTSGLYIKGIKIMEKQQKSYTITKKIAKHGKQAVIVIPSFLREDLKPQTIVEVRINVIKEAIENE